MFQVLSAQRGRESTLSPQGPGEGLARRRSVRSEEGELRGPENPHLGMTCWEWTGPADTPSVGSTLSIQTGSLSDRQDLSAPTQL